MTDACHLVFPLVHYLIEEWSHAINNWIVTWGFSSFARLHFFDRFRHHHCSNLNGRPFHKNTFLPNNIYIVSFQPFFAILKIRITITVDASKLLSLSVLFRKTSCCFSSFFSFKLFFFTASTFPLLPELSFHFNCIIHCFVPLPRFFVQLTATSCPSTYLICSFKKSIFDRRPTVVHSYKNSLIFHGHSLLKFFSHTSIFQLFPLGGMRMGFIQVLLTQIITNK